MQVALSTMWAQQDRFRGHMDDFARIAAEAGYSAIEPSHSTDTEGLESLIDCDILPLSSLHAPTPRRRDWHGRWNGELNLASTDDEERAAAVAATCATIDYAARTGASAVVVHLGACGNGLLDSERRLRTLSRDAGDRQSMLQLRRDAEQRRAALAVIHLPRASRSLEELAGYAAQHGIAIGLENRLHYHEIPRFDEVPQLLAGYPPTLVGYWHDVGHAEVLHRLGLVEQRDWLDVNGPRTIGSHLHDVRGILDHRAPGEGDVNWDYIRKGLPNDALRTVEINQHEPESYLAPALRCLIEAGLVVANYQPEATPLAPPAEGRP